MKKFLRHKTSDEIKAQCDAQGLVLDMSQYDRGADSITIRGGGAYVVYNVTNGNFYGETPDGVEFENTSTLDGTPWFDALLNFFMAEPA